MSDYEDSLNEPNDIKTRIDILKRVIKKYEMDLVFAVEPELYDSIITTINNEKEILERYKEKYPEYFI